jgi:hypothetical protein
MRNITKSIIALALLAACDGGDGNTARPRYSSGVVVTGPVSVSSLSSGQLQQICASFDAYVDANIGFDQIAYIACLPLAIVLGGSKDGCQQQLAACIQAFPAPISVQAHVHDPQLCFQSLQQCQASVSILENCVNLNLDLALDILDHWSCSGASDPDLQKAAAHAMDTASVCGQADAACGRFASLGPD